MSHPHAWALRLGLLIVSLCVGCDELAPQDYAGEYGLSIHGTAQLDGENTLDGLQVAVAFRASDKHTLRLLDTRTQGEFPNQFTLDVYDRPPAEALMTPRDHPDEGRFALGVIAAVPHDHPAFVELVSTDVFTQGATTACGADGCMCAGEGCMRTNNTCLRSARSRCFIQSFLCPRLNSEDAECREISREGDEALTRLPWSQLAGLSRNYLILYLETDAPPGGLYATGFGADAGLPAGYHLVASEEVPAAADACDHIAIELAASINEASNVQYTIEELRAGTCKAEPCPLRYPEQFNVDVAEYEQLTRCHEPVTERHVVSPDQPISLQLGKVMPLDRLNL